MWGQNIFLLAYSLLQGLVQPFQHNLLLLLSIYSLVSPCTLHSLYDRLVIDTEIYTLLCSMPLLITFSAPHLIYLETACPSSPKVLYSLLLSQPDIHPTLILLINPPSLWQPYSFTCNLINPYHTACFGLKLCFPQNSYVEILNPKLLVSEGGPFGSWLGHKGRGPMNRLVSSWKRPQRASLLAIPAMWGHRRQRAWLSVNRELGPHQNMTRMVPSSWTSSP